MKECQGEGDAALSNNGILVEFTGHLESTFENAKDSFYHIAQLRVAKVEQFFLVLGPMQLLSGGQIKRSDLTYF